MAGPVDPSHVACGEERLRWTITSLFGVGLDLVAAATVIEGDARDRIDRAVSELDQVIAALRYRFYEALECGSDADPSTGLDGSP